MSSATAPHPGYFQVLVSPRAYASLLYLLLCLATGVLAFTYTVTGLSLSLGLAILIFGVPVALAFLAGARLLSLAETSWLRLLLGRHDLAVPPSLPAGEGWMERARSLVVDARTWTSLLYFLLLMPLGVVYFSLLVTLLSVDLALVLAPFAALLHVPVSLEFGGPAWLSSHPHALLVLAGLAGVGLLPTIFHLALLLGRFQAWLASHLLVRA
jgi:hypothetical protein